MVNKDEYFSNTDIYARDQYGGTFFADDENLPLLIDPEFTDPRDAAFYLPDKRDERTQTGDVADIVEAIETGLESVNVPDVSIPVVDDLDSAQFETPVVPGEEDSPTVFVTPTPEEDPPTPDLSLPEVEAIESPEDVVVTPPEIQDETLDFTLPEAPEDEPVDVALSPPEVQDEVAQPVELDPIDPDDDIGDLTFPDTEEPETDALDVTIEPPDLDEPGGDPTPQSSASFEAFQGPLDVEIVTEGVSEPVLLPQREPTRPTPTEVGRPVTPDIPTAPAIEQIVEPIRQQNQQIINLFQLVDINIQQTRTRLNVIEDGLYRKCGTSA